MKGLGIIVILILVSVRGFPQAQINTKRFEIRDLPDRTLKVVMTGNICLDTALRGAVKDCWTVSPYEFCDMEEFDALKGDADYYFLVAAPGKEGRQGARDVMMLRLLKGGQKAGKGMDKMLGVVSAPLCPAGQPPGREVVFLHDLVCIVQSFAVRAMESEIGACRGLRTNVGNMSGAYGMRIVFAESDVSFDRDDPDFENLERRNVFVVSDMEEGMEVLNMSRNTLVSYSVHPLHPIMSGKKSFCYNMLMDPSTRELYYFRRYRITGRSGAGFRKGDLIRILR